MTQLHCTDDDLNDAFLLLANSRRRAILKAVTTSEGSVTAGRLAELIAAEEDGIPPDSVTGQPRKRVYISLTQTHLPTLEEAGAIVWNRDTHEVAEGSDARRYDDAMTAFVSEWTGRDNGPGRLWDRFRVALGDD